MAIRVTRTGVGLAVGIIVLAIVVFGGLWLVKERGEQARRDEAIKVAEQNLQEESNKDVALQDEATSGEKTAEEKAADQKAAAEKEKAEQERVASEKAAEEARQEAARTTAELPQTGPAENAATLLVVALVTFAGASYLHSRRVLLEA